MKNIIKKGSNELDIMAEARKDKMFQRYSKSASLRIRLAVETFNTREAKGLSQQRLAKATFSTQKIISKIESGDVNIGIDMLDRLSEALEFNVDNFVRIFYHLEQNRKIEVSSPIKQNMRQAFSDFFGSDNRIFNCDVQTSLKSNSA